MKMGFKKGLFGNKLTIRMKGMKLLEGISPPESGRNLPEYQAPGTWENGTVDCLPGPSLKWPIKSTRRPIKRRCKLPAFRCFIWQTISNIPKKVGFVRGLRNVVPPKGLDYLLSYPVLAAL